MCSVIVNDPDTHVTFVQRLSTWINRGDLPEDIRSQMKEFLTGSVEFADHKPINWNDIKDETDLRIWRLLNSNVWWPEKIALSKDLPTWNPLEQGNKTRITKAFVGLTDLDTLQSRIGARIVSQYALTPHEPAVMDQINFMESVHAQSYSSVFSTFCSTREINEAYEWAENNPWLLKKKAIIRKAYASGDGLMVRIASVMLESFLFYSGFYLPLYYASEGILTNTGDLIKLIIRDESAHGWYIGYKFQEALRQLPEDQYDVYMEKTYNLLMELYDVECSYADDLYAGSGLVDDVKAFMRYNGNKACMLLGFPEWFSEESTETSTRVIAGLDSVDNHDYFSGAGSTYKMIPVQDLNDNDFEGVLAAYDNFQKLAA